MRVIILLMLVFFFQTSANEVNKPQHLNDLRWQYRIIIVNADSEMSADIISQLNYFKEEVDDRDIIWFVSSDKQFDSNAGFTLSTSFLEQLKSYNYRDNNVKVVCVLIGKDGGIKLRQSKWNIENIFSLIDTMPMRQREMKKQ